MGTIKELELQKSFDLHAATWRGGALQRDRVGSYVSDFLYREKNQRGEWLEWPTIEDVKGGKATMTPLFRWKWKHMQIEYPSFIYRLFQADTRRER